MASPIECQLPRTGTCEGCEILELYRGIAADYTAGKIDKPTARINTSNANKVAAGIGCSKISYLRGIALKQADPSRAARGVFTIKTGEKREITKIW
jgi:hypothetical protein